MIEVPKSELPGSSGVETNVKKTIKIYVSVNAATSKTSDDSYKTMNSTAAKKFVSQINAYWKAESNGYITAVFGGYEARSLKQSSCGSSHDIYSKVTSVAFGGAFKSYSWIDTNKHLLVLTKEKCNGGQGFGTVGANGGLVFSSYGMGSTLGLPVILHEMGHNLGFRHANASVCPAGLNYDAPQEQISLYYDQTCATEEYSDFLDIMGYTISGKKVTRLSSAQKIQKGWISNFTELVENDTRTTFQLKPLGSSTGSQALRITDPNTGDIYYVEYRIKGGQDSQSIEFGTTNTCVKAGEYQLCQRNTSATTGGVRIIRIVDGAGTTALATAPVSGKAANFRRAHLRSGESFTSHSGDIKFTVNSLSTTAGANITVLVGNPPPMTVTTTALTTSHETLPYGSEQVTVTATLTTSDATVPDGTFTLFDGKTVVSKNPGMGGIAMFSLPVTLAGGTHAFSVKFTPTDTSNVIPSASNTGTVVVSKLSSTTTSTLVAKSIKKNTRYSTYVTVTVENVAAPTGTIYAYNGSKKIGTYKLTSAGKGTVKVTLPKFKKGKHGVYFKYAGNTNITGSSNAKVTLSAR